MGLVMAGGVNNQIAGEIGTMQVTEKVGRNNMLDIGRPDSDGEQLRGVQNKRAEAQPMRRSLNQSIEY
jgi:hypothetical protein